MRRSAGFRSDPRPEARCLPEEGLSAHDLQHRRAIHREPHRREIVKEQGCIPLHRERCVDCPTRAGSRTLPRWSILMAAMNVTIPEPVSPAARAASPARSATAIAETPMAMAMAPSWRHATVVAAGRDSPAGNISWTAAATQPRPGRQNARTPRATSGIGSQPSPSRRMRSRPARGRRSARWLRWRGCRRH